MSDYESKLADWLRYVESQAAQMKKAISAPKEEKDEPERILRKVPARENLNAMPDLKREALAPETPPMDRRRLPPSEILNEGIQIPEIDDFLPFLKEPPADRTSGVSPEGPAAGAPPAGTEQPAPGSRPVPPRPPERGPEIPGGRRADVPRQEIPPSKPLAEKTPPAADRTAPFDTQPDQIERHGQSSLFQGEGTGIPRPRPQAPPQPKESEIERKEHAERREEAAACQPDSEVRLSQVLAPEGNISTVDLKQLWEQVLKLIPSLLGTEQPEVAQNSYKRFKESRVELISRLVDPPLTLEQTARILNVCPTTVRRYTNRGILPHFRTAGNQRRFRFSDVLSFMQSMQRNTPGAGSRRPN